MNSVLQQLYMLPPIRDSVMKLNEAAQDLMVQQQEEERKESLERPVNRPSKTEVRAWLCKMKTLEMCEDHLTRSAA